jgi:hypothetical protein
VSPFFVQVCTAAKAMMPLYQLIEARLLAGTRSNGERYQCAGHGTAQYRYGAVADPPAALFHFSRHLRGRHP